MSAAEWPRHPTPDPLTPTGTPRPCCLPPPRATRPSSFPRHIPVAMRLGPQVRGGGTVKQQPPSHFSSVVCLLCWTSPGARAGWTHTSPSQCQSYVRRPPGDPWPEEPIPGKEGRGRHSPPATADSKSQPRPAHNLGSWAPPIKNNGKPAWTEGRCLKPLPNAPPRGSRYGKCPLLALSKMT